MSLMSSNSGRYSFWGALAVLVLAVGYAVIAGALGAAFQLVALVAPLLILLLLAYLAIRALARSGAEP